MNLEEFEKYVQIKEDGRLKHREKKDLEFKQNYNFGAIRDGSLPKSIAAFANADGGVFIFGIKDKPREPIGLSNDNFEKIEIEKITNFLNEHFSPEIIFNIESFSSDGKNYGVFIITASRNKPVVCIKNAKYLSEGDIYYRYSARSDKIKYPELKKLLDQRKEEEQKKWMEHIQNIAKIGVENVTLMDIYKGKIFHNQDKQIIVDSNLLQNINFIREGKFVEKEGAPALKLIGEIQGVKAYSANMNLKDDWYTTKELGEKLGLLTGKGSTAYMTAVIKKFNIQNDNQYFQSKNKQKFYSKLCYEFLRDKNLTLEQAQAIHRDR